MREQPAKSNPLVGVCLLARSSSHTPGLGKLRRGRCWRAFIWSAARTETRKAATSAMNGTRRR